MNNNNNFGYTFGAAPRSSSTSEPGEQNSQSSQDYVIDLSKIVPPTFRFGQFGQIGANGETIENIEVPAEPVETEPTAEPAAETSSGDNDSFLAEPSISAGQFDASFSQNTFETPKSDTSSASSSKAPLLVEELLEQPDFLEEPAPHSVEELLKATIDGDTTEVLMESWEDVGMEEILLAEAEKAAHITEYIKNEPIIVVAGDVEPMTTTENTKSEIVETTEPVVTTTDIAEPAEPKAKKAKAARTVPVKSVKAVADKPVKATIAKPVKATKPANPVATLPAVEGKRQRKTVERLTETIQPAKPATEKSVQIPKGTGMKLGEIEVINQNLTKRLASDKTVTILHKIIFDRVGEARNRKSNLRSFCGVEEPQNFETKLQKFTNAELKELTELLGLSGGNEKTALVSKINDFLVKPSMGACTKKKVAPKKSGVAKKAKASAVVTAKKTKAPASKRANPVKVLTPEFVDSDVESDVEREVLDELKKGTKKQKI